MESFDEMAAGEETQIQSFIETMKLQADEEALLRTALAKLGHTDVTATNRLERHEPAPTPEAAHDDFADGFEFDDTMVRNSSTLSNQWDWDPQFQSALGGQHSFSRELEPNEPEPEPHSKPEPEPELEPESPRRPSTAPVSSPVDRSHPKYKFVDL